jgi:hypothetical protein
VNDDNQENRPRIGSFRYVVLTLAALLVLSLGFALIPADPPAPPPPPFTEQARAAAFDDVLELRAAGLQLRAAGSDGGAAAPAAAAVVDEVVSLLTLQARALLAPQASAQASRPASTASGTASAPATASGAASPPSTSPAMTAPELANALAASGAERLQDAKTADGGMARLLAGAGTAQILAARELAAAAGAPAPVTADPAATSPVTVPEPAPDQTTQAPATSAATGGPASATSPAGTPVGSCPAAPSTQGAAPGVALAAAAAAERAAVYAYQAALTRLPPDLAGPASEFLQSHEELAEDAERLARLACAKLPPQQPGYVLAPDFLAAPAAGLAQLEAGTLPGYGDVVATTEGTSRTWALAALQAAAARTAHWGGDAGPTPGLLLDGARLPELPA